MEINNITFYDKEGFPYEFKDVTDDTCTYKYTEVFLQPLSVSLYDCLNIFLLEKFDDGYYFPQLNDGESLEFRWNDLTEDGEEQNFFLFDVKTDVETQYPYIEKIDYDFLRYNNDERFFKRIEGTTVGKVPYQLNVAFSPTEEIQYERILNIYYNSADGERKLCWKIYFYGEGLEEDDRFRVHIENFGIKFNRTDALCLKDYDINEALPDWEQINAVRKELIVNKEEVFPYVGTYYGLKNIISILGYNDVLDVKEYWEDVQKSSLYKGKYLITSVSAMLEDGEIKDFNVLGDNRSVKNSEMFRKTGFLALCYEFTRKTGEYDDNECPIIERTTDFTTNEMFYKLHRLKDILQKDFLPVNVQIKDVIGEFMYYVSFAKLVWVDDLKINEYTLDKDYDDVQIDIYPNETQMYIQDLYQFYKVENEYNYELPCKTINIYDLDGLPNIDSGISLTDENIPQYCEMIKSFYEYKLEDRFDVYQDFDRYPDDFADLLKEGLTEYKKPMFQNHKTIGCPMLFYLNIPQIKAEDLQFTSMVDFAKIPNVEDNNSIVKNLKFKDFVEVEWSVKYSEGYTLDGTKRAETLLYTYRTSISRGLYFPVFLKYTGLYSVSVKVWDMSGNAHRTTLNKVIEVKGEYPEIVAGFIGDDKFDFTVGNLKNVRISDFGQSTAEHLVVNILNNNDAKALDIQQSMVDTFKISEWADNAEVYNFEERKWENYKQTTNTNREQYGFGDNGFALQVNLFKNAQIRDLFHLRACDCYFSRDFVPGFAMRGLMKGDILYIGNVGIEIKYSNPQDIVDYLNGKKDVIDKNTMKVLSMYHFDLSYCHNWCADDSDTTCICDMEDFEQKEFKPEPNVIVAVSEAVSSDACQFVKIIGNGEIDKNYSFVYQRNSREYAKNRLIEKGYQRYIPLLMLDIPLNEILNLDTVTLESMLEKGYKRLPVIFNENYLNVQNCKFQRGNVVIPTYKIVIFFVNNIDRKVEFQWTLRDSITGEILMMTRGCPFFLWHFDFEGVFDLEYYTKDAFGNEYTTTNEKFIQVVKKNEYIENIEKELNDKINNKKS